MKSFLFPKEGRNTFVNYLLSFGVIFIGTYVLGSIIAFLCMTLVAPISPETDLTKIAQYFSKNQYLLINLLPFFMGVLSFYFVAKFILKRSFFSLITSRGQIDWKRFGLSFSIWFAILLVTSIISFSMEPELAQWNFKSDQFLLLLLIGIFGIILQTLFEELLLRGFFLQFGALFLKKGILNIVLNALIFGALHLANPEIDELGYIAVLYYVLCGIFEGILAVMDDGIELAWGFHFANNFFVVVLFNTTWGALPTDSLFLDLTKPEFGLETLIVPLVTFPLLLLLFKRIYKWENWKSKLF